MQALQRLDDVAAEAMLVAQRTVGIVHALVDGAPQMLQEAAEDARVYGADVVLRVQV